MMLVHGKRQDDVPDRMTLLRHKGEHDVPE